MIFFEVFQQSMEVGEVKTAADKVGKLGKQVSTLLKLKYLCASDLNGKETHN
jgi:hypothetical protein